MYGVVIGLSDQTQAALDAARSARCAAEHAEWQALVDGARELTAEIDAEPDPFRRLVYRSSIPLALGQRLGLSDGQVSARLTAADRVIACAPAVWAAFGEGRLDAARIWLIAAALHQLEKESSWQRLERLVVAYAESHTAAQLRLWLKRFVARVEAEQFNARADEARRQRYLRITHGDDGMSLVEASVPSFVAAAVESRITAAATSLGQEPDNERTLAQRRADVFSEWLLSAEHAPASVTVDIGVTIPVLALTGSSGAPAISDDGHWAIPASWALDSEVTSIPFWHRILVNPVTDDILTHEYLGRYPPDVLRRALQFRDMTCRAPGCTKPADRCDMDHRRSWPDGRTSGDNLWALCRRHHNLKGHGVLQWVLPGGATVPA